MANEEEDLIDLSGRQYGSSFSNRELTELMDSSTNNTTSPSTTSGQPMLPSDPLTERMRSILRLSSPGPPTPQRGRRFSDADTSRPISGDLDLMQFPAANLSKDNLRWQNENKERSATASHKNIPSSSLQPHNCTAADCSVIKVFHTTELLELIFSHLEFRDLLLLRQINQQCNYTIKESKSLRLQFFMHGQWRRPGAEFQLLPLTLPGVTIEAGEALHLGQWIEVSFTPEAARRISPCPKSTTRIRSRSIFEGLRGGLGPKPLNDPWPANNATSAISDSLQYEDLLISQPPVVGMQAFVVSSHAVVTGDEDETANNATPACAKLSIDTGMTLGLLAETAQSFLARNDGPSDQEHVKVIFKAIMSFSEPDQAPRKRTGKRTVFYI